MDTIDRSKRKSKINTWKPKDYQVIVERDGKLFVCHFDRLFGHSEKLKIYNRFLIGKESYINQLDVITSYTNFFINNYNMINFNNCNINIHFNSNISSSFKFVF